MSASVVVYIWSGNPDSNRVRRLISLFSPDYFKVIITNPQPPPETQSNGDLTIEEINLAKQYRMILQQAATSYPDLPVLIVLETTLSQSSSEIIQETVETVLSLDDWQLCYLSRFLDRCDLHQQRVSIDDLDIYLASSKYANGIQANLFNPQGRDMILGQLPLLDGSYFTLNYPLITQLRMLTQNNQLNARVVVPNLLEYDIQDAIGDADYVKLSECASTSSSSTSDKKAVDPGPGPAIIFLIIVFVILLISWALYQIGPDYGTHKHKK